MRAPLITALLLFAVALPAQAQLGSSGDPAMDEKLRQLLSMSVLSMQCQLPDFQPQLTELKRSWAPSTDNLIQRFFGSKDAVLSDEQVTSPLWGKGRRYKSGMVLHMAPLDRQSQRISLDQMTGVEVVPTFLDVYSSGFVYANNITHKPVYATDVKVLSEVKADVSHHNEYNEKEGQDAAEALLSEMFGQLKAPAGFQTAVKAIIQHFGERLFVYRLQPEYVTSYDVRKDDGSTVKRQVAVPVLDSYAHVMLDGDKLLCGLEYFWDASLAPVGTPKKCISAADAEFVAREQLIKHFDNQPPLLNCSQVTLGFIQDRSDRTRLIPVWLFDAWYTDYVPGKESAIAKTATNLVTIPMPFYVNALDESFGLL
jgi:hypothetical protein